MKKLLSVMTALILTSGASVSLVACSDFHTNPDQAQAQAIKKLVEAGIDGSNLNIKNTDQDALTLLQNTKGIKDVATLSFVNQDDANKNLTAGNDDLDIKITVNTTSL